MSVEKTTVTLLKHQVLSLAQLVVYVVYDEAIASGQATSANLLLVTELSEALMWRLGSTAGSSTASGAEGLLKFKQSKVHIYVGVQVNCTCRHGQAQGPQGQHKFGNSASSQS